MSGGGEVLSSAACVRRYGDSISTSRLEAAAAEWRARARGDAELEARARERGEGGRRANPRMRREQT